MKSGQQKSLEKSEKAKSLRDGRKRLGWSQERLAEHFDIHATYLSQLESGERNVDDWYLGEVERLEKSNNIKENAIREEPHESDAALWRRRALAAEKAFSDLRTAMRSVLDIASIPTTIEPQEKK